ncbi:MAG: hypothetical protein IJI65_06960 [Lachnospiraceae bacterium]|nr:hypothetical protein [Lachnospiraceae bacterium]
MVINEMLGKKNVLYLIASSRYRHEIFHNLVGMGVDKGSIYVPPEKYITGIRGNQYFDVFAPNESEVFVDAGAFDGSTVESFLKWAGDKVRQVYSIEPLGEMCDCIQNKFLDMRCVEVVNGGVWDKSGEVLKFNDNRPSTSLGLNGQMQVSTIAIDDLTDTPQHL